MELWMGYRPRKASREIYVLILEARWGSDPKYGPQNGDPKLAPTESETGPLEAKSAPERGTGCLVGRNAAK